MIYYLIGINVIAFIIYGIDKLKAKRNQWRVPEKTLLFLAIIGGSIGALVAMKVFRHKTKHLLFTIGVPLIIILQIAAYFVLRIYW